MRVAQTPWVEGFWLFWFRCGFDFFTIAIFRRYLLDVGDLGKIVGEICSQRIPTRLRYADK